MEKQEQIKQIKLMLSRLDSDINVDAGGHRHNPVAVYTDPELAERERAEFFQGSPQLLGLSADLPGPGSFLTLNELATPVLATRDNEGRFRAFVNACRHRGVAVEDRERGTAKRFTCPFHSWTYDTGGALVGLPKQEQFGALDKDCHGLIALPSEERHGLLWFHPQPDGELDLDQVLTADLSEELRHYNLADLVHIGGDSYTMECNWKLAMDTFGETYHFETLHKNTLANGFYGNCQCYDTFGHNHRMLLCKREIDAVRHLPEDEWRITAATLPVYWLFPNVQLMPNDGGLFLVQAYPDLKVPGRHTSRVSFYLRPGLAADEQVKMMFSEMSRSFGAVIRDEDYATGESQQRSAESGVISHSVFGRNEPALHHYHNVYRSKLGLDLLPLIEA